MFRIVQMKVPAEQMYKAAEQLGPSQLGGHWAAERLHKVCEEIGEFNGYFLCEPMATTSQKYFEVEQCLRSLFGDPPHLFADLTADYKLARTRAPQSYDYGYVVEIGRVDGLDGKEERLVAYPREKAWHQEGRYSSGLYTPIDCE